MSYRTCPNCTTKHLFPSAEQDLRGFPCNHCGEILPPIHSLEDWIVMLEERICQLERRSHKHAT